MKKFFSLLLSMVSDNSGGVSSMRALMLLTVLTVLTILAKAAWVTNTIPDVPVGLLGFVGMMVGGKVVQRFGEAPEVLPPSAPQSTSQTVTMPG